MTDLEVLDSNISELKDWLSAAWRQLARSSLTKFEHRELRLEMKRCSAELRSCFELLDKMRTDERKSVSDDSTSSKLRVLEFRLIGGQSKHGLAIVQREQPAI